MKHKRKRYKLPGAQESVGIEKIRAVMHILEKEFLKDARIRGAFYCGSSGTGLRDEYSDIDLVLVTEEKERRKVFHDVPKVLERAVGLRSKVDNDGKGEEWCCLVTDDLIGVDIPVMTKEMLTPSYRFAHIKVLKDNRGTIKKFKKKSAQMPIRIDRKQFENNMRDLLNAQLYLARHVQRGWLAKASRDTAAYGEMLYNYLLLIKGSKFHAPDLRDAEISLAKKEFRMLMATRSFSANREEIGKAMAAVWRLTAYVAELYEKKTGRRVFDEKTTKEVLKRAKAVSNGKAL